MWKKLLKIFVFSFIGVLIDVFSCYQMPGGTKGVGFVNSFIGITIYFFPLYFFGLGIFQFLFAVKGPKLNSIYISIILLILILGLSFIEISKIDIVRRVVIVVFLTSVFLLTKLESKPVDNQ
jgi:hypothetical protein